MLTVCSRMLGGVMSIFKRQLGSRVDIGELTLVTQTAIGTLSANATPRCSWVS